MSNTDSELNTVEWNQLPWRKIQKVVFKLQKRIYRAYINGDVRKGRRLQKTLIKSYYNRLLSVRKVTQDNSGKKTAGVDKVKSLTPKQRLELAKNLTLTNKSKPIRRVWIPKPGKDEKRNIALHGMETRIKQVKGASLIRYADDFVIFHENLEKLKQCQSIIGEWLAQFDLEIKPSKTKVVNTLHEHDGNKPGFDFLGFNIRQYPVGKYQSGKNPHGKTLGFKTLIRPTKNSIKTHYEKVAETCRFHNSSSQEVLISKLAPIISGWCNYYKTVVSKKTFSKLSKLTYTRLFQWAKRRHPNKNSRWVVNKYWTSIGGDNWVFGANSEINLMKHSKVAIKRHIKVKGNKTPFDGDTTYWGTRMGQHPELKASIAKLLKKQEGKCNWCKLPFQVEDLIESDHIIPKSIGGLNTQDNLQLLHKHCHDIKTSNDLMLIKKHKETN